MVIGRQQANSPVASRATASSAEPTAAANRSFPLRRACALVNLQSTQMVAAVMPFISFEMVGSGPSRLNTPWKCPLYRYRPFRLLYHSGRVTTAPSGWFSMPASGAA